VVIVDGAGRPKAESAFHDGLLGTTAWAPSGDEVWFTIDGEAVRAMDLAGRERSILRSPQMRLEGIGPDGRVLLASRNTVYGINGKAPTDDKERDLTYYGWSLADDVSADGRTFVFTEGGEADRQNNWSIFLRGMDGSPPQRLGLGYGGKISPDSNWVAAIMPAKGDDGLQLTATPTGPGEPRQLTTAPDQKYRVVGWLPDSSGVIYITVTETMQGWLARIDGSPPSPITPPGWWIGEASPDGKYVVAENGPSQQDNILYLYAIDGREKVPLPIDASQWGIYGFQDARHLIVGSNKEGGLMGPGGIRLPRRLHLIDITTGKAEPWKEFGGQLPRAGLASVSRFQASADGQSYVYNYSTALATLYIADGLR
jgi:hypothetical protein